MWKATHNSQRHVCFTMITPLYSIWKTLMSTLFCILKERMYIYHRHWGRPWLLNSVPKKWDSRYVHFSLKESICPHFNIFFRDENEYTEFIYCVSKRCYYKPAPRLEQNRTWKSIENALRTSRPDHCTSQNRLHHHTQHSSSKRGFHSRNSTHFCCRRPRVHSSLEICSKYANKTAFRDGPIEAAYCIPLCKAWTTDIKFHH